MHSSKRHSCAEQGMQGSQATTTSSRLAVIRPGLCVLGLVTNTRVLQSLRAHLTTLVNNKTLSKEPKFHSHVPAAVPTAHMHMQTHTYILNHPIFIASTTIAINWWLASHERPPKPRFTASCTFTCSHTSAGTHSRTLASADVFQACVHSSVPPPHPHLFLHPTTP